MALTTGLQIPKGIQPTIAVPVDSYSGPYSGADSATAIAAANAAIPAASRFQSMEVRLIIAGTPYKYWYKDGTADGNLVEFVSSSISVSNATDNRVLTSTGTSLGINAESNLLFDGTDLTVTGDVNVNGATSADIKTTTATATIFDQPTTLSMGAAATSLTVGGVTTAATTNISTGAISTGTKTINIGTGGTAGSTTTIAIGTAGGGSGTTTVNGNLSVTGNTTLGDAAGDTLTINSTAVSIPNNLNFDTNTLYIDATNNRVGIGTASPTTPLYVAGNATVTGNISVNGNSTLGDASGDTLTFNASTLSVPNNLNIGSNTLYINQSSGYVGINNNSPAYDLDVTGKIKTSSDIIVGSNTIKAQLGAASYIFNDTAASVYIGGTAAINKIGGTSSNDTSFYFGTNPTSTGKTKDVELGTGGLSGSTTNILIGSASGGTSTTTIQGNFQTNGNTTIGDALADSLTVKAGTVSLPNGNLNFDSGTLYIDATNNRVGIANSSPSTALDVAGDLTLSGDVAVNGGDITTTASTLNIGNTTAAFTANLSTGETISGATKTVNLGTGSAAGSTTNVNIGSALGTSTTTVNGAFSVTGDTTLGDVAGDTITFNASTAAIPNNFNFGSNSLYINSTNKSIGVGNNSAKATLDVYGDGLFRTTANSTNGVIHPKSMGDGLGAKIEFGTYGATGDGTNFGDYGDVGVYGSNFNINSKGRNISFKIDDVERMNLSSTSPYSLTLTDGSILMTSTSARAITHTGASGQNLTISSTNGNVLIEGSTFNGNDVTVPGFITFGGSTALKDSGNATALSLPGSGNVTVAGILRVNGDTIRDSGGNSVITFSSGNSFVEGNLTVKSISYFNPSTGTTANLNSSVVDIELFTNAAVTGTINIGTSASTVRLGSISGTVELRNDLSIPDGNIIGGLSANTAGGTTAATAVEIPYTSDFISRLSPGATTIHYRLPTAAGNTGRILMIKNVSAANNLTLYTGVSGEQIDGKYTSYGDPSPSGLTLTNTAGASGLNAITVYSNGSNWFIINSHRLPS